MFSLCQQFKTSLYRYIEIGMYVFVFLQYGPRKKNPLICSYFNLVIYEFS